jgi:hypothetical protein
MKNLRKVATILSILAMIQHCQADDFTGNFSSDIQRYYGGGQGDPRSYIDTNNRIDMSSYIIANPYPNNYPGGSGESYNYPGSPNQQYFQPADGSLNNGIYYTINKTAKTPLHQYNNVIIIDGTVKTPTLNAKAKYVDKQGKEYQIIGSINIPSEDASDINTYYLFGQLTDHTNQDNYTKKTTNVAAQSYNSQGE